MPGKTKTQPDNRFANLVIRASAGTGKTFQLSNRYLTLLERGVSADQILATTFTRKAAGEILDRIVLRLAAAAENAADRQSLGEFLGCKSLSRNRCLGMLRDLLHKLHRLRICTLDSLFGQIARATSLELGLPPDWEIINELAEDSLRDAAIAAVLRQESTAELVRLAHLLAKGETRRGVGQMVRDTVRELHSLFQETSAKAWHSIPHHKSLDAAEIDRLLNQLLQIPFADNRAVKARDVDVERARANDWDSFAERGLSNKILAGESTYYGKPVPQQAIQIYQQLLDQSRAVIVNRIAMQTEGSFELLHKFDTARHQLQEEQGGVRFDDITHYLDVALNREESATARRNQAAGNPATDHLLFRLDGQISHVLLDEFQDTAPRQWRVLRPLVKRAARGDEQASFFCVGDAKQAIYGWRGGVAEIFDALDHEVPKLNRCGLVQSFRSAPPIIHTVNRVFHNIHKHPVFDQFPGALDSWCRQIEEHSTARNELNGYVTLRTAAVSADCESPYAAVLSSAAETIESLIHSAPGRSIGVLVRTNDTVAAMIHALRMRHVPASEEGGNPLTDSAAVQLVLSLFRLADHPGDKVVRFHLATSPLSGPAQFHSHEDAQAARRLATEIRTSLLTDGYGRTVQKWSDVLVDHVGSRDRMRLEQLVEMAFLYQGQATLRADDFVRHVEHHRVADPSRALVRVMTVHQSKGLEFDIVVLPELDFSLSGQTPQFVVERPDPTASITRVCRYANAQVRQLLPQPIQQMFERHANQEMSESLCVLYVALTRASQALYMVIAPSKENEKSVPRTFAGLLRATLTDGNLSPAATTLFEEGDPQWMVARNSQAAKAKASKQSSGKATGELAGTPSNSTAKITATPVLNPKEIRLATSDRRSRGVVRISPSSLEGGKNLRWTKGFDLGGEIAAIRGTLLHAWFQQIEWLDDGVVDDAKLQDLAGGLIEPRLAKKHLGEWLIIFREMLAQPAVGGQLRRLAYQKHSATRLTVETERPFAIPEETGLLTGNIDRLVLLFDHDKLIGADIIDFKTDQLDHDDERGWKTRFDFYRPQLEAYRRAVSVLTNLPSERISSRLLFVASGRLAELP